MDASTNDTVSDPKQVDNQTDLIGFNKYECDVNSDEVQEHSNMKNRSNNDSHAQCSEVSTVNE